jgi:hypothetical protein
VNGNIIMGLGAALGVWGAVALVGYAKAAEGIAFIAGGIALLVVGNRQRKRGQ